MGLDRRAGDFDIVVRRGNARALVDRRARNPAGAAGLVGLVASVFTGFFESGNNFRKLWRDGLDISDNYSTLHLSDNNADTGETTTQHTRGIDNGNSHRN